MTSGGSRLRRRVSGFALGTLVAVAAYVAIHLHRRGHTTGDDFALYLRQARSLFEGNIAQVISDNRLLFENSTAVTPPIYPWGFPLLLSPMVRLFGLDFGRLKLVEVAAFCAWLVVFHGIVRRRAGRIVAIAITAVFATAPVYLVHTDQLLTEFPHMLAVAVFIWWLDRVMLRNRLTAAPPAELVALGLLMVAAYNIRRESVVLVFVVLAAQVVDVIGARQRAGEAGKASPWRRGRNPLAALPWRRLGVPYLSFAVGAIIAQLLLPSTLVPDNGNSRSFIATRLFNLRDDNRPNYPKHVLLQLGFQERPIFGLVVLFVAFGGVIVACSRAPRLNVPLATLMVTTMLVIGTHFRMVSRYYFQVTPLVVFFVTILLLAAVTGIVSLFTSVHGLRVRRVIAVIAVLPLVWVTAIHLWSIPSRLDSATRFNDSGAIQSGPARPQIAAAFDAVLENTGPDDIIVFYRARTMTLYTERRALQTSSLDTMADNGDYFMQNRQSDYSQPDESDSELRAAGFEVVWEDDMWRLWRIPAA